MDHSPAPTTPHRLAPDSAHLPAVLALIQDAFAFMDGQINPPSSMHALTCDGIRQHCLTGEVWAIGAPPLACLFLTPKTDALYLGKLAVAQAARRRGFARQLVACAHDRARALGLPALELQTRIELVENHAVFGRLGFVKTAETAHPGFDRPTSITMRCPVTGIT